jgi:alpha-D-ribose 1-methylphosphonate 5-triphosphate synthase subunit PhnL
MSAAVIEVRNLSKTFTLHNQGGTRLPALRNISLDVAAGECVALAGPSGAGKSSLLKCVYGNYLASSGTVAVRAGGRKFELVHAAPRDIIALRRRTLGYVTQFLRVIPRVPTLDVVSEPLRSLGVSRLEAEKKAKELLNRLDIPERLWSLAPATFSGGEQQRVNIARGFAVEYPALLLDEPTAALDIDNRRMVVRMIREAKSQGAAIIGIFHDLEVRDAVSDRVVNISPLKAVA